MNKKKKRQIVLTDDARNNLIRFAESRHLGGGLSGTIEYIAWHLDCICTDSDSKQAKDDNKN